MGVLYMARFALPLQVRSAGGDGLTVWGKIVPFGETTIFEDPIDRRPRKERFMRGSLDSITKPTMHTIKLGMEHESGYVSNVGKMVDLDQRPDGAYATFRLYRQDAEKAVDHLETTHTGLSLEFYDQFNGRRVGTDGVVERHLVTVARVAAVPDPAYDSARVLVMRNRATALAEVVKETLAKGEAPVEGEHQGEGEAPKRSNAEKAAAILAEMERNRPEVIK